MKKLFVCFLVGVINYTGVVAQNIEKLPVEWTFMCDRDEISDLKQNPEFFAEVTRVTIEGSGSSTDWKRLLKALSRLPKLEEVHLQSNNLTKLPRSISKLWFVPCIHLHDHEDFDLNTLSRSLSANSSLVELSFEVTQIADLPSNISELNQLAQLGLVNPEMSAEEEKRTIVFQIPIRKDGRVIKEIHAELKTWKESPEDRNQRLVEQSKIKDSSRPIAETPTRFEKEWKSFAPPVEALDVQKSYFTTNTAYCDTLVYKRSGTKLIVPPAAFVDKMGNSVEGPVQIDYREFRDPLDFVFSGIPMSFQENDSTVSFFSSAGMFEVNASVNGDEVFLAEGKDIEVKFASTDSTKTYNTYSFNDEKGSWEQTGNNNPANFDMPKITEAIKEYNRLYYLTPFERDTTLFDERFTNFKYTHTYLEKSANWFANSYSGKKKVRPIYKCVRGTYFRTSKAGEVLFKIETNRNYHPEMRSLQETNWKLIDNYTSRELRKLVGTKSSFNDIRIEDDGGSYKMILKGDTSFLTLRVQPVQATLQDKHKVYSSIDIDYKKYQKKLEIRRKSADKKIRKDKKLYYKNEPEKIIAIYRMVKPYMNDAEQKMSAEEFRKYVLITQHKVDSISDTENFNALSFTRSLYLSQMGITNCDIESRMTEPLKVFASFKEDSKKTINPENTFVIIPSLNASIEYFNGQTPQQIILLDRSRESIVLVVDENNNVSYTRCTPSELNAPDFHRYQTFTLVHVGNSDNSLAEIKSKIGI